MDSKKKVKAGIRFIKKVTIKDGVRTEKELSKDEMQEWINAHKINTEVSDDNAGI